MEQIEKRGSLTPWLLFWIGLNMADWVLTVLVLRAGGAETNEIYYRLGEPLYIAVKFVVPILAIMLLVRVKRYVTIALCLGMIVVVYHNLTWLL